MLTKTPRLVLVKIWLSQSRKSSCMGILAPGSSPSLHNSGSSIFQADTLWYHKYFVEKPWQLHKSSQVPHQPLLLWCTLAFYPNNLAFRGLASWEELIEDTSEFFVDTLKAAFADGPLSSMEGVDLLVCLLICLVCFGLVGWLPCNLTWGHPHNTM